MTRQVVFSREAEEEIWSGSSTTLLSASCDQSVDVQKVSDSGLVRELLIPFGAAG